MSGWTDLPLSPIGIAQVQCLRDRLLGESPFDAIYTSPLRRSHDTAAALTDACADPIRVLDDLRELNCGAVDGLAIEQVRRDFPAEWEENLRQDNPDFRWPGGESYRELRLRSVRALDGIARQRPGRRVLVVTHCGVITQIAGVIHGCSPACWQCFCVENTSVTEVLWSRAAGTFLAFNDFEHTRRLRNLPLTLAPV